MALRRLLPACALVLALASYATPPAPAEDAPPPAAAPAPPAYSGPTTDSRVELEKALRRAADEQAWAEGVERTRAEQEAATVPPTPRSARRTDRTGAAPAPPAAAVGTGDAASAIAAHFAGLEDQATGVARCESGLDPGQVSSGGGNWGLFQINTVHRGDFVQFAGAILDDQGAPADDPRRTWQGGVLNADLNAAYARKLYDGEHGWRPAWACAWAAG